MKETVNPQKITARALVLGAVIAALFAYVTAYFENRERVYATATQLAVIPFVLVMLMVVLINPLCRLLRFVRTFSLAEILVIFVMGSVSSGISTFGLAAQLGPMISSLFNPDWNKDQAEWNLYVEPYVNEDFFIGAPNREEREELRQKAELRLRWAGEILAAARACTEAAATVRSADQRLKEAGEAGGDTTAAQAEVDRARAAEAKARTSWATLAAQPRAWRGLLGEGQAPPPAETVATEFPARVRELEAALADREPALGIQERAIRYREALDRVRATQKVLNEAMTYDRASEAARAAEEKLHQAEAATDDAAAFNLARATQQLAVARQAEQEAKHGWDAVLADRDLWALLLGANDPAPSLAQVLATYQTRIRDLEAVTARHRAALQELETIAFERIKTFRTRLPEGQRAIPGLVFLPQEGTAIYVARFRRLMHGLSARWKLQDARQRVVQGAAPTAPEVQALLAAAVTRLQQISDPTAIEARKAALQAERDQLSRTINGLENANEKLQQERRTARRKEFDRIDDTVHANQKRIAKLKKQVTEQDADRDLVLRELAVTGNIRGVLTDLQAFPAPTAVAPAAQLQALITRFHNFDASLRRYFVGDVPWGIWLRPLLYWAVVIGLTYLVLMTFNVLIFRQWAHNERLIYPHAQLTELLAGGDQRPDDPAWIPPIFRSGFFWIGFAVTIGFLGWNFLVRMGQGLGWDWTAGLGQLDFDKRWGVYINNSVFAPLLPSAKSHIFFSLIGLSFLIPAEISFSLWFFWILYMVQLLILCWSGYGVNENSFQPEWYYTLNFRTAEGGGALMVFAAVILWKCRHYLLCFFSPRAIRELEPDEQQELRISSLLFFVGSLLLILALWRGLGADLRWTVFSYLVIMVITIGLVRAVTEGGLIGFQAWVSPFHFIRTLFGMNRTWTSPSLFTPLFVYYSIMFLDIKTFIAPTMANAIKVRDDLRLERRRFHLAIFVGIALAAVTAVITHVILGYSKGGDNMNDWFYSGFPRDLYTQIAAMTHTRPEDLTANRWWLGLGGLTMAALIWLRQTMFWLPHPIGAIMLVNPIMGTYWFSIFLGWLAKRLVTKYGNKETYSHFRYLFIGLIAGELVLCALSLVVLVTLGAKVTVDLNRN